jgi:hypothetical protein
MFDLQPSNKIKREVVLGTGERFVAKTACFAYCSEEDEHGIQKESPENQPNHEVTLKFPRILKHKIQVVDSNHQWTRPGRKEPVPPRTYQTLTQNQVGNVSGIFFVRTNHPYVLADQNRRKAANKWVNILNFCIRSCCFINYKYKLGLYYDQVNLK